MADKREQDEIVWAGDEHVREEPYSEEEAADIGALLEIGYDQLDGFVAWLEETVRVDTRTAQQDCFNAECLIDYLANQYHKTALEINEFELRWFLFSHYIRKAMADGETEERLPASLQRFFHFLQAEHAASIPDWILRVLDDEAFYLKRRNDYAQLDSENERKWEQGFREWCAELEEDLDLRILWLPRELGDGLQWGDVLGWREATLQEEANRLWQEERAHLLQEGMSYDRVREHLMESYRLWLDTPQSKLDGLTPLETILEERGDSTEER
jgi:hypothetical protein